MKITINPEVFKIKDPRVEKLRTGRLSAEVFANLLGPGDPFLLIGDMIFAMTETEFYASRAVMPVNAMSEKSFRQVLDMKDLSFMHKMDRDFVEKVRKDLPTCPACRYKRYKDEVYKLAKKYNIKLEQNIPAADLGLSADKAVYPETDGQVETLASLILRHMFRTVAPERKACIDCVEKHVSQAWVLANETLNGYPEHLAFVVAHLGEAIDEMPPDMAQLRASVMFCLAKTKKDGAPFVPIYLLLPLINLARAEMGQSMDEQADNIADSRTEDMDIDFTDAMREELSLLDTLRLSTLARRLENSNGAAARGDRIPWQGQLGVAADSIVHTCPKTAGMLRNRRLLFIGDTTLATGEWSFEPMIKYINEICSARRKDS